MLDEHDAREVIGRTAYTRDGDKIGSIGQLYLDDETGAPEFVSVNTGLLGTNESLVPVAEADLQDDDRLVVPYTKDQVKDAPNVPVDDGHLDEDDEERLYRHYSLAYTPRDPGHGTADGLDAARDAEPSRTAGTDPDGRTSGAAGSGTGVTGDALTGTAGRDTSGPTTDDAMTRSEEELHVGTTQRQSGRARLRKYVTTEHETRTAPVRKEKAVLETEPVTEADRGSALDGPDISEEEHEVVLHEDEVTVTSEAKPVERVRLGTETVTEEETVSGEVRKEHIEAEGDVDDDRRR